MIYLNNAGTTWPKPQSVQVAINEALNAEPSQWGEIFATAHELTARFLKLGPDETGGLHFTSGCTAALTLACTNLIWKPGDRIVTSSLEHHALARWLFKLFDEKDVSLSTAPYAAGRPFDLEFLESELKRGGVRLVAVSHASNTTGELLPLADIVQLAHEHDALVLLDGAQTMGVVPVHPGSAGLNVDLFTFAGHKGPLAPHGIGGIYVAPDVPLRVPAAVCEVTPGTPPAARNCDSFLSFCDVGSFNVSAGAGLFAGLAYLQERSSALRKQGLDFHKRLRRGLGQLKGVKLYGGNDPGQHVHLVSLGLGAGSVQEAGAALRRKGIVVGAGFHCAPAAHEAIGSVGQNGTLRLSTGPFTTKDDVDTAIDALREYLAGQ